MTKASRSKIGCGFCTFVTFVTVAPASVPLGICENPKSKHYQHIITPSHPTCVKFHIVVSPQQAEEA